MIDVLSVAVGNALIFVLVNCCFIKTFINMNGLHVQFVNLFCLTRMVRELEGGSVSPVIYLVTHPLGLLRPFSNTETSRAEDVRRKPRGLNQRTSTAHTYSEVNGQCGIVYC